MMPLESRMMARNYAMSRDYTRQRMARGIIIRCLRCDHQERVEVIDYHRGRNDRERCQGVRCTQCGGPVERLELMP